MTKYVLPPTMTIPGSSPSAAPQQYVRGVASRIINSSLTNRYSGTRHYDTQVHDSGALKYGKLTDADYTAFNGAVTFADCTVSTSITGEVADANSVLDCYPNFGIHNQVCMLFGDSILIGAANSDVYHSLWTQPIVGKNVPYTLDATAPTPAWPGSIYTNRMVGRYSRMCIVQAHSGYYFYRVAGGTYDSTTFGWDDFPNTFDALPTYSNQQIVFVSEIGTNQYNYGGAGGYVYGSPTQGSPNLITNGAAAFASLAKSRYPNCKVVILTPIARGDFGGVNHTTTVADANNQFNNMAVWLTTPGNAASINVDVVIDTRNMPQYDCRNWANVTANTTYYFPDTTHPTDLGITTIFGPFLTQYLDGLL